MKCDVRASPVSSWRSACVGSAKDGRFTNTNAIWKGRHDQFGVEATRASASANVSVGSSRRANPTMVWRRCCHMVWFANANASAAIGSDANSSMPIR